MKITAVKPILAAYAHRNIFLVKVETDAGIYGWGEGGISGREAGMAGIVESFQPSLLGEDPLRIDHLWQVMFRGGFFESGTVMSGAISAIDLALWDIMGKALNVPCWQLLGGRSRDRVECYTWANLEIMKQRLDEGWRALRLEARPAARKNPSAEYLSSDAQKEGEVFDSDDAVRGSIDTMLKAREIAGEEIKLCIDFHTRFNPPAAVQACEGIAKMRPFFIEDPLRSPSPKSYVAFRKRTTVPLAVGEECSSKWEFQQLIEEDAIDFARIDICNVGGLTESKKVASMAETHYIDVVPHNPLGPFSTAACLHLSVALPNFSIMEYGHGAELSLDLFKPSFRFKAPYYEIPSAPGLGVDVDESKLAAHPFKPWTTPRFRKPDGSFTNW